MRPTVITDLPAAARHCREEIFGPVVVVSPRSTGTQGASCNTDSDCAAGYTCVRVLSDGGSARSCLAYCLTSTPSCPVAATSCRQFDPALVLGGTGYGICHE